MPRFLICDDPHQVKAIESQYVLHTQVPRYIGKITFDNNGKTVLTPAYIDDREQVEPLVAREALDAGLDFYEWTARRAVAQAKA